MCHKESVNEVGRNMFGQEVENELGRSLCGQAVELNAKDVCLPEETRSPRPTLTNTAPSGNDSTPHQLQIQSLELPHRGKASRSQSDHSYYSYYS